jgi:hypothetical protein
MGGSTNEGITSGLDTPKRGLVDGPGKYSQNLPFDMSKVLSQTREQMTPENLAMYAPYIDRPEGEGLSRFLINFGLNLASTPPTGKGFSGLISTAAGAAKEPTAQLFEDLDTQRLSKRAAEADLFKTLLQGNIDVAASAAEGSGEAGAKTYAQLEIADKIKTEVANIARLKKEINALPEEGTPQFNKDTKDALMLELRQSSESLDFLRKKNPQAEALLKNETIVDGLVASIMQELSKDREKYPQGMQDKQLYIDAIAEFQAIIQGAKTQDLAEGGRVGYMIGGGVGGGADMGANKVTETATTPEPTKVPNMPISYDQLRARLPKEIGDDIVRLIASSPEALEDFATIATQSDVDLFNQKYNVNLVLPQEA